MAGAEGLKLDIIGDVHGQCEKLVGLLQHLGYESHQGSWKHPNRTAIFVGDLIDRGPEQVKTVDLVRGMEATGAARCILGNHEFNAIAWATRDPKDPSKWLRDHDRPGNFEQHEAFLSEVQGTPQHQEILDWFQTLPMWLDLGGIRVVHACWHQASIDKLKTPAGPEGRLTDELVRLGNERGSWAYQAIETVCKGPEVELPPGISFADKGGKIRHEVRVRWWQEDLSTYRKAAIGPPGDMKMIPDVPMPAEWQAHTYAGPPVIFGHYWFTGTPTVISPKFACVDYSAANDGPLVAYQWDGERELSSDKLNWAGKDQKADKL
jgi:hypothetical protein